MNSSLPENEPARLAALRRYAILDTPPDEAFERVTRMAARLFQVPIALVSLVDENRQWWKSCWGLEGRETLRDLAFCAHAILGREVMVIPDATRDPRFSANPLVTAAPGIRFYAGAPLRTSDGFNLGTLCVIDTKPREFSPDETALLADLAAVVVVQLEGVRAANSLRTELTERKQAEAQIRASEARFRSVTQSVGDAIISSNAAGHIIFWNSGAENIFGHREDEVLGQPLAVIMPERFREMHRAGMKRVLAGGEGRVIGKTVELVGLAKDGREFPIELTLSTWSTGEGIFFTGIIRDITERKHAGEALEAAKTSAEAANRAKSEFLANMSHEIRTPMNGILGMTALTLDTELNREQREYLGMVKSSAGALLTVVNDILDFSKIEAGKLELEAVGFSLRDCLGEMLKPLGLRADQKGLALTADISAGVPDHLVGDPTRLRQILVNLTDNAIKFTARGTVLLRVAVEAAPVVRELLECASPLALSEGSPGAEPPTRSPHPKRQRTGALQNASDSEPVSDTAEVLHFSVADTGIGIAAEKQAVIFDAFAQADGSTTRTHGGTGLGLAIASQLVRQMGGRLWVESTVGAGTTFHFTARLPVLPAPEPSVTPADSRPLNGGRAPVVSDDANATPPVRAVTSLRILLAEDNGINRALATALLETRGHSLVQAVNGREAVEAAAREAFDLICMDVQMPEMDGLEATRRIRELEAPLGRHTPIVAMTAHAMTGDRERCLAAGMDDYLSKPLQRAELFALLERLTGPAAPAPRTLPIFSRARLLEQLDGDEALLLRLIALFQENTPRLLDDIRGSIARRGSGDLARSAHALLGSFGAFGANDARRLTQQLEAQAHEENYEHTDRTFAALERETAEVHAALAAFTPG